MPQVDYKSPSYPPDYRPIVTFDTSTHNRLYDDGVSDEQLATIRAQRHVRVAGLGVEEMYATPNAAERAELLKYAKRVVEEKDADTLLPHNELIRKLILAHDDNPWNFDWTTVDVRADEYHDELIRQELLTDDTLAAEQRQHQNDMQKRFRQLWTSLRPRLDEDFEKYDEARPLTYRDALARMKTAAQPLDTSICKWFYDRVAETNLSRHKAREFLAICDPLRAVINGILMARYDLALRDLHKGERFQSGRIDLYMSVYLPYCDEFVTDEKKGEQARCLKEIAEVTGLHTNVLTFDEFYAGLL